MPCREGGLHGLKPDPSARADDQNCRHGVMLPFGSAWLSVMCDAGSRTARWVDGLKRAFRPLWSHAARLTSPRNWLARGSLLVADIGGRLTSAASCQTQCRKDVGARKELASFGGTSAFSQQLA